MGNTRKRMRRTTVPRVFSSAISPISRLKKSWISLVKAAVTARHCAPCQPFSPHQKNETRSEDAKLVAEFGRLISELKPEWVFFENVPGIKKVRGFSTFRRFRKSLDEMKYMCCESSVDTKRYGVPQNAPAFVLIASKVASPSFPVPTHGPGTLPYRTVPTQLPTCRRSGLERRPPKLRIIVQRR